MFRKGLVIFTGVIAYKNLSPLSAIGVSRCEDKHSGKISLHVSCPSNLL